MEGTYMPQPTSFGMPPSPPPPPSLGGMMHHQSPPMNVMSVVSNYGNEFPKEIFNSMPTGYGGVDPSTQTMATYYPSTPGLGEAQTNPSLMANMRQFVNFNMQELAYYKNLWNLVDPQNTGYVDGPTGADFLQKSSLPQEILMEVWNIADPNGLGMLDSQAFFCACRLIAHVQNGSLLSPEAVNIEPVGLPNFDLSQRNNSEISAYESMPKGALAEAGAEAAQFATPVNADANKFRSTQAFNWDDMMTRLPSVPVEDLSWDIPEEYQLKYRHLFHMYDANSDGFIEGHEARKFFYTSGLTKNELSLIWELSDNDKDGRLSLPEFAVAVHLIQCRQKAMPIPTHLPPGLAKILTQGLITAKTSQELVEKDKPSSPLSSMKKTEGETKKEPRSVALENAVEFNTSVEELSEAAAGGVPASIVERLAEGDRRIRKNFAMDVDSCADELRTLGELNDKIREEVVTERKEIARQMERKKDFYQRVLEEREKIEKLKEERRQCELERLAASRDLHHYEEELSFLRRQMQDAQNDIKHLQVSNLALEKTHQRTEVYISTLDTARKTVINSLKTERAILAEEEKEIRELRSSLERIRRDKDDVQSRNSILQERLRQAEQDRMLLVSSIESERAKLLAVKDNRLHLSNDRRSVAQEIANVAQQTWRQSTTGNEGFPPALPVRTASQYRTTPQASSVPYGLARDAKGVPAGFTSPVRETAMQISRNDWRERAPSEKNSWTLFGKGEPSEKSFSVQRSGARKKISLVPEVPFPRPSGSRNLQIPSNSVVNDITLTPAVEEWKASPSPAVEEDVFSANFDDDFPDFANGMEATSESWKKLGVSEVKPPLENFPTA